MVSLLLLLILAVIVAVVFSHMALYVIGGLLGLLIVLITCFVKRRKQK